MQAKGAKLIEAKSLAGTSHLKQVRLCRCERCQGLKKGAPTRTMAAIKDQH
jgi:hypothetical protein